MKPFVCLSVLALALLPTGCGDGYADTGATAEPMPSSSSTHSDAAPAPDAGLLDSRDAGPSIDSQPATDGDAAAIQADTGPESSIAEAAADSPQPCPGTMADCDQDPSHLCEINLNLDPLNCGACGNACPSPSICDSGKCVNHCAPMTGDCNGVLADGCEADLDLEDNCGACGKACPAVSFGSPICWDAVCYAHCDSGRDDCDHQYDNGCEIDSLHDVNNCGSCGQACSFAHASSTCADGTCRLGVCESGWGDCNGDPADGCEVSLSNTAAHCGFCGHDCGNGVVCMAGTCTPTASLQAAEIRDLAVAGQLAAVATDRGVGTTYGYGPAFLDPEDYLAANSTAFALAADDSGVFWLEHNGLLRRTTGSGVLVSDLATSLIDPVDLAVDSKSVYLLANGKLGRISKSGGAITLIASNMSAAQRIEVDGDAIYVAAGSKISRVLKMGYGLQLLITAAAPVRALHPRDGYLYWLADDEVWRINGAGGTAEHMVSAPGIADFDVADSTVYFTSGSAVVRFGAQGIQTLAWAAEPATHIAVANNQLWWVAGNKAYRTPR